MKTPIVFLVALIACAPAKTPARATATEPSGLEGDEPVASSAPVASASVTPSASASIPATNPFKPKTYSSTDLRLSTLSASKRVVFADEGEAIVEAIAESFAKRTELGFKPIDLKALRALEKEILAGDVPEANWKCRPLKDAREMESAMYPGASRAYVDFDCTDKDCALDVIVYPPTSKTGSDPKTHYRMSLPRSATLADWPRAITKHVWAIEGDTPPKAGLKIGILGSTNAGPNSPAKLKISIENVFAEGRWTTTLDDDWLQPHVEDLAKCGASTDPPKLSVKQLIAADANGRLTHCEARYFEDLAQPDSACVCKVLSAIDWGKGDASRRASFDLRSLSTPTAWRKGSHVAGSVQITESDDAMAVGGVFFQDNDDAEVAACFSPVRSGGLGASFGITMDIGAEGVPTSVTIDTDNPLPDATRTCLSRGLTHVHFGCPLQWHAHVKAAATWMAFSN